MKIAHKTPIGLGLMGVSSLSALWLLSARQIFLPDGSLLDDDFNLARIGIILSLLNWLFFTGLALVYRGLKD